MSSNGMRTNLVRKPIRTLNEQSEFSERIAFLKQTFINERLAYFFDFIAIMEFLNRFSLRERTMQLSFGYIHGFFA